MGRPKGGTSGNVTRKDIGLFFIILSLFIIMFFFLGCDKSSQVKTQIKKPSGMSNELYVYQICKQAAQISSDGVLKDTVTHNALECQNESQSLTDRAKLDRVKEIYLFCSSTDKHVDHKWQECFNIFIK